RFSRDWSSDVCSSDLPHQRDAADDERKCDRHADGHGAQQGAHEDQQRHQATSAIWPSPTKRAMSSSLTFPVKTCASRTAAITKRSEERRVGKEARARG